MSAVTLNQLSTIKTLALFNISLSLEFIVPIQEEASSPRIDNIIDKHLEWPDIVKLAYPNISESWLNEVEIWYIPLMSRGAGQKFYQFLLGGDKSINETTDREWSKMCATEEWINPITLIRGFGQTQVVRCSVDPKVIGAWNTTYWSDRDDRIDKGSVAMTYTDNNLYVVELRVWKDQTKDWIVYSTNTKINAKEMDSILRHVTSLGFNPIDVVSVPYDNCRSSVL